MDRQTAHTTYLQHRPSALLAACGISRCISGCGTWPCNLWLAARDARDRDDTAAMDRIRAMAAEMRAQNAAGVAAMTDTIGTRPSDELSHYAAGGPNHGRWL